MIRNENLDFKVFDRLMWLSAGNEQYLKMKTEFLSTAI